MQVQTESTPFRWDQLSLYSRAEEQTLVRLMREGTPPAFDDLAGYEFDGINIGVLPGLIRVRKFRKGFYEGPERSGGPRPFIQGFNIPVEQNGVGQPHLALPDPQSPKRFGFYRVYRVRPGSMDALYPNALMLDYGMGANGVDPSRFLRDYMVQVYPDDPTLLLGHALIALGPTRRAVSFFVLKRAGRHSFAG